MAKELAPGAVSGRRRVIEGALCGAVAGFAAAWFAPWQLTILVGWDAAALFVVGRAWFHLGRLDAARTREYATLEDNSRASSQLVLIVAGSVSLVGVALAFVEANDTSGGMEIVLRGTGILTIALSWAVIHTMYTLRYAHLYYRDPVGGIDFKNDAEPPDYRDFAYLAFTVGMTYQVSDTDITSKAVRRATLPHALLAFFFGTVILATTVNLIASLLND